MKVYVDKFSSTVRRVNLNNPVDVKRFESLNIGDVVIVRILNYNPNYSVIETSSGKLERIGEGEVIAGVIGSRMALRGFVGVAPDRVPDDDILYLLNLGGVIGLHLDSTPILGDPIKLKYLGNATDSDGRPVNIRSFALELEDKFISEIPVVLVIGTCMNVGKTLCATELIRNLSLAGYKVGSAKVSGVGALKDLNTMRSAGAVKTYSFLDFGIPSTVDALNLSDIVKSIITRLNRDGVDVIVIELGDGIMGYYGVDLILHDSDIVNSVSSTILCASDIMSAFGAMVYLVQIGLRISLISGPVTDNIAGYGFIERHFGIPAVNSVKNSKLIFKIVEGEIRSVLKTKDLYQW
jgi:hypothetical protein